MQGHSPASRGIWRTWQEGGRWREAPVVQSSFGATDPALSPDGRWLAYVSDESGRAEVFVQPFPGPGARQQVSISGGIEPFWSRHGRTLFYLTHPATAGALRVMTAVTITAMAAGGLALGAPMPLFSSPYMSTTPVRANDAAPDGRLLMIMPDEASAPPVTDVTIVINWFDEPRRRAPVAGLRSP